MLLSDIIPKEARITGNLEGCHVQGLSADSRAIKPGFVFAALKGVKSDGALFIDQAINAGAIAILTEDTKLTYDVPIIAVENARHALAKMAAAFYPRQPDVIAAITGTAGKTSAAAFLRQIWQKAGKNAASIGTVGVVSAVETIYGSLTTPDPVALHQTLDRLADKGVTHLALEASSHGLDQARLDGVRLTLGAFTNLGRDHMDYHASVEDYFHAKMGLFERLLPKGAAMVVDTDSPFGRTALERGLDAGCMSFTTGSDGDSIRLLSIEPEQSGQRLMLDFGVGPVTVFLPLVGRFQTSNALVAATLALATGITPEVICSALEGLKGEAGRLEYIGKNKAGALVFIDYAHKVEALENVLDALRPYAENHLIVVFGAGGDRDMGKRPLMGKVAHDKADQVIITDDNPRSEEPAMIRAAILAEVPGGVEISDREKAIFHAIETAGAGDVVVIAGKGHETGQIVGDRVLPFSDHEVARRALGNDLEEVS